MRYQAAPRPEEKSSEYVKIYKIHQRMSNKKADLLETGSSYLVGTAGFKPAVFKKFFQDL